MTERYIELTKDDSSSNTFGFNIKGGIDLGCPVYIWRVEPDSLADNAGILSGDEIMSANDVDFTQITHTEALKVLKSTSHLNLFLRTSHLPTNANTNYYSWADCYNGDPTQPPSDMELLRAPRRLVDLVIESGQNLGLMIRGGSEYGLGIYITGVDRGSVAERMGLKRGDEILQVNNKSFTNLPHDAAVNILKSSRKMILTVAFIGKIPIDLKDFDKSTSSVLGMIEEKARTVLNKSEHSRFTFYRLEYTNGFVGLNSFVRVLLEILNTEEKYTLLTEVREIIREEDLSQFDELIYNKECLKGGPVPDMNLIPTISNRENDRDRDRDLLDREDQLPTSLQPHSETNNGDLIYLREFQHQEGGGGFLRGSSTGGGGGGTDQPRMQPIGGVERDGVSKKELLTNPVPGVNSSPAIRYRVRIQKTKATLGITIEGGSNTAHRLPRIINIHPTGSGYENSNLKPGVVIVSVDGVKVDGLSHEDVAKLIKDSYDSGKKYIDLVVVENRSNCIVLGGIGE